MQKVYWIECPACRKEYYLHKLTYEAATSNPEQKLKCPFCKKEFAFRETAVKK